MNTISRRAVLAALASSGALSLAPRLSKAGSGLPLLRATPSTAQLAPEGFPQTRVWAYAIANSAGTIPGPEIRVRAGDRVQYRLINELPQPTAVHWHGIRIANGMDGAAPLTQAPVQTGDDFEYDFVAPDPGTYWYHSHNRSTEQVARGLAGPLIVEDREPWLGEPGAATRELTLLLDDWLLDRDAAILEGRWDDLHAAAHGGRMGNTVTVNGSAYPELEIRPGERVRLRFINAATDRIMRLSLPEMSARLIALDGHPVAPRALDDFILAPAQRVDVVVDGRTTDGARTALLLDPGNREWVEIAGFVHSGESLAPSEAEVRPLPAWGSLPVPDMSNPQHQPLVMEGGAMRGMQEATYHGKQMDFRELTSHGMAWAFNGVAHGMEEPMYRAQLGQTIHMELTNKSAFPHAIHLHGHHFTVQSKSGSANQPGDVRDTVLVGADETVAIAFVADNPGVWMLHCHMLSHQKTGMMGWFEVA
jgi:FtsP/CotA-like multicopper oxidase with cupredoxin domain